MNVALEKSLAGLAGKLNVSIKQSIDIENLLVVRVDMSGTIKHGDIKLDRNVYAFNQDGKQVWQIEAAPIKQSPKPYVNLSIKNNELIAENWVGTELSVNLKNGVVAPYDIGQRPW